MQALVGTRTAADINLAAQIVILIGLLIGFLLARRKRFDQHANVQTVMVLFNLLLIVGVMATSFYAYVIAGGTTTGRVAQLMIGHAALGVVVEGVALYLILRMRTKLIPLRLRVGNIKLWMRTTLALWTLLVLLGVGIYAERYLLQRPVVSAPLLELRQLGADLYVHAVELGDARDRESLPAIKRHAEHLVNLIEGKQGLHYGDNDANGRLEDPGDGVGLLARLDAVAEATADPALTAQAGAVRGELDRIIALSLELLGAPSLEGTKARVDEVVELARKANAEGVIDIDFAAREAGVVEAPSVAFATVAAGEPVTVTVHEDEFRFVPSQVTIPVGTTVIWVNDERAKHTATADDGLFDSGDQNLGDSFTYTFNAPGRYPYYCRFHGDVDGVGMAGTIVVE
jgi:plastocyanin